MTAPRTCVTCHTPMVPRRFGQVVPEGFKRHEARGYCEACYVAPSDSKPYVDPMWSGKAVGDIYTSTFHRYAPPPPWVDDALCAQVDHDVFFPERGTSTRAAKRICAECPIVAECLEYALENREQYGVWGGLSPEERAELLRQRRVS